MFYYLLPLILSLARKCHSSCIPIPILPFHLVCKKNIRHVPIPMENSMEDLYPLSRCVPQFRSCHAPDIVAAEPHPLTLLLTFASCQTSLCRTLKIFCYTVKTSTNCHVDTYVCIDERWELKYFTVETLGITVEHWEFEYLTQLSIGSLNTVQLNIGCLITIQLNILNWLLSGSGKRR